MRGIACGAIPFIIVTEIILYKNKSSSFELLLFEDSYVMNKQIIFRQLSDIHVFHRYSCKQDG